MGGSPRTARGDERDSHAPAERIDIHSSATRPLRQYKLSLDELESLEAGFDDLPAISSFITWMQIQRLAEERGISSERIGLGARGLERYLDWDCKDAVTDREIHAAFGLLLELLVWKCSAVRPAISGITNGEGLRDAWVARAVETYRTDKPGCSDLEALRESELVGLLLPHRDQLEDSDLLKIPRKGRTILKALER